MLECDKSNSILRTAILLGLEAEPRERLISSIVTISRSNRWCRWEATASKAFIRIFRFFQFSFSLPAEAKCSSLTPICTTFDSSQFCFQLSVRSLCETWINAKPSSFFVQELSINFHSPTVTTHSLTSSAYQQNILADKAGPSALDPPSSPSPSFLQPPPPQLSQKNVLWPLERQSTI